MTKNREKKERKERKKYTYKLSFTIRVMDKDVHSKQEFKYYRDLNDFIHKLKTGGTFWGSKAKLVKHHFKQSPR